MTDPCAVLVNREQDYASRLAGKDIGGEVDLF